jgi:hypothetical protein
MSNWTNDAIIEEAKKWRWIPEGTQHYTYDRFELVAYPSAWKENFAEPRNDQPPDQLMIDEALAAARELGLPSLKWRERNVPSRFGNYCSAIRIPQSAFVLSDPPVADAFQTGKE